MHINTWPRFIGAIIVLALVGSFLGWWLSAGRAYSAEPVEQIVLSNHRVVLSSTLPHCGTEDQHAPECTWNVGQPVDGNGQGVSLWIQPDGHVQYVWPENIVEVSMGRWRWVPGRIRKSINESGYTDWMWMDPSCVYRHTGDDYSVVRCADGRKFVINY